MLLLQLRSPGGRRLANLIGGAMALPSARRPVEIEEELRECQEYQKKASLKIKVNLIKVFMDTMIDWYHNKLSQKKRKTLKKKAIINKATKVAFDMKLKYSALPHNWLRQLHDDHGVNFIYTPPAEKAKIRAKRRLKQAYILGKLSRADMELQTEKMKSGNIPPEMILADSKTLVPGKPASEKRGNGFKLIDLTHEPPPPAWTTAFANGELLPRVIKVHKFEDRKEIVVYYDYEANVEREDGKPIGKYLVHEANNFLPWK